MAKTIIATKPMPPPHTTAFLAFEENLNSIGHMLKLGARKAVALRARSRRLTTLVPKDLSTKPVRAKLVRSLKRFAKTLETRTGRIQTITLWQVVMMVTCVEAYLQDVLSAAASVDPELMSKSEQCAPYGEVIAAASLEALANKLRVHYLGFKLYPDGRYEEVFNGPGRLIYERYARRKGIGVVLLSFPVPELQRLSKAVPRHERISRRVV